MWEITKRIARTICFFPAGLVLAASSSIAQDQIKDFEEDFRIYPSPYIYYQPRVETFDRETFLDASRLSPEAVFFAENARYQIREKNAFFLPQMALYARNYLLANPSQEVESFLRHLDFLEDSIITGGFNPAKLFDIWSQFLEPIAEKTKIPLLELYVSTGLDFASEMASIIHREEHQSRLEDLYSFNYKDQGRTWLMIYEEAEKDEKLKEVMVKWFARKYLNVAPGDGIEEILVKSPNFYNAIKQTDILSLLENMKTKPDQKLLNSRLEEARRSTSSQLVSSIENAAGTSSLDQEGAQSPNTLPEVQWDPAAIKLKHNNARLYVGLTTKLAYLFGDAETARIAVNVARFSDHLIDLSETVNLWAAGAVSGVQAATGIAGSTAAIAGFLGGLGKADPMAQQLNQLAIAIEGLRVEMHHRFDAVDRRLGSIFSLLSQTYSLLSSVNADVRGIRRSLLGVESRLLRDFDNVYFMLQDLGEREFVERNDECFFLPQLSGQPLQRNIIESCLLYFQTYTLRHAYDSISRGPRSVSLKNKDIAYELGRLPGISSVPYILTLLQDRYRAPEIYSSSLPNPAKWAAGASAFAQMTRVATQEGLGNVSFLSVLHEMKQQSAEIRSSLDRSFAFVSADDRAFYSSLWNDYTQASHAINKALSYRALQYSSMYVAEHDLWVENPLEQEGDIYYPVIPFCEDYDYSRETALGRVRKKMILHAPTDNWLTEKAWHDGHAWYDDGLRKKIKYLEDAGVAKLNVCFSDIFVNREFNASARFGGLRDVTWRIRAELVLPKASEGVAIRELLFDEGFNPTTNCGNMEFYRVLEVCWNGGLERMYTLGKFFERMMREDVRAKINRVFRDQIEAHRAAALHDAIARGMEYDDQLGAAMGSIDGVLALERAIIKLFYGDQIYERQTLYDSLFGSNRLVSQLDLYAAVSCEPIGNSKCAGLQAQIAETLWSDGPEGLGTLLLDRLRSHRSTILEVVSKTLRRTTLVEVASADEMINAAIREVRNGLGVGASSCPSVSPRNLSKTPVLNADAMPSASPQTPRLTFDIAAEPLAGSRASVYVIVVFRGSVLEVDLPSEVLEPEASFSLPLPWRMMPDDITTLGIMICSDRSGISPGLKIDSITVDFSGNGQDWDYAAKWKDIGWIGAREPGIPSMIYLMDGMPYTAYERPVVSTATYQ